MTKITIILLVNFLMCYKVRLISKIINIFDTPNTKLKLHKKKVALLGGFIGLVNLTIGIIFFRENFFFIKDINLYMLFTIGLLTCIGFLDDKINLSGRFKTVILLIFFMMFLILFPNFNLKYFQIDSINLSIKLTSEHSIFFSLLCIFVLINAINFFDGIDLQSTTYLLLAYLYLYLYTQEFMILILIISLASILFLNYKNKIFQGDSGIFFYSFILSCYLINSNNLQIINSEQIILLTLLPIIDMLRVFFERIKNKQNPMIGDRNHIHHILQKKFNKLITVLITNSTIFVPLILFEYYNNFILSIILSTFLYFVSFFYCTKNIT